MLKHFAASGSEAPDPMIWSRGGALTPVLAVASARVARVWSDSREHRTQSELFYRRLLVGLSDQFASAVTNFGNSAALDRPCRAEK